MQRSNQSSLSDFQRISLDDLRSLQFEHDPLEQALLSLRDATVKVFERCIKLTMKPQILVSAKR
jgi:hypothetical protein